MHVQGTTPRERLLAALHTLAGFGDTVSTLIRRELDTRRRAIDGLNALANQSAQSEAHRGDYAEYAAELCAKHGVDPSDSVGRLSLLASLPMTADDAQPFRATLQRPIQVLDEARAALDAGGAVGLDAEGRDATTIGADLIAYRRLVDDFARGLTEPRLPPPDMPERIREVAARLRRAADLLTHAPAQPATPAKAREAVSNAVAASDAPLEKYAAFIASSDVRVTTCPAWKSLMQFRQELLTNPRQDSGVLCWWSRWVGTMQHWLYGGGGWGNGYYGPSHRETTPDCAVCVADLERRTHELYGKSKRYKSDSANESRTMFFPANSTYHYNGFVVDWTQPFPPIALRGPLVEWIESWIDRIQYVEATGRYPWEPDTPPTPTLPVSPDLLARLEAVAAVLPAVLEGNRAGPDRDAGVIDPLGARDDGLTPCKKPKPTRRERKVEWLAKAMLTVQDHPEWSDATIAQQVGIDKSRLSRSREHKAAANIARTPKTPDGSVTIADGDRSVEAVDDSFDPNRRASRQWQEEEDLDDRIDREMNETQRKPQRGTVQTPANRRSGGA
jgi:hypothetical protein